MANTRRSSIPQLVIFIGVLCVFLYIANLVVYEALAAIFNWNATIQLVALGLVLGILSASFIAANLIGMSSYNLFTRIYYTISAVWLGIFTYLFLASIIYGLIVAVTGDPLRSVGAILMIIALLTSLYGLIHAREIKVKNVSVTLPNLPPAWMGKKMLWVSDVHLGQLHGPKFAHRVADAIRTIPHDVVFIGGDLFDGTGAPDIQELIAPFRNLPAPLGTYFITGNHEEFGDNAQFLAAVRSVGITILMDEAVDVNGLQILGVDYHNASDAERFRTILRSLSISKDVPSILLKHEPKDLKVAHEAGVSMQISGHTHRGQQWPLGYAAKLIYRGYSYGLKDFKGMQVYVSSGVGSWGPPIRVGTDAEIVVFNLS